MSSRDIIVWGIMFAVVLVLARIIWGTPLVTRVREGFANAKALNASTVCPKGSKMYMYNGVAHCCSGKINTDVDTARETCVAPFPTRGSEPFVFCSLGPTATGIPNCLELRSGQIQVDGQKYCTTGMSNFAMGSKGSTTQNGRCCSSAVNTDMTDCNDPSSAYCDVTTESNIFTVPNSCQFQRLGQDTTCPPNFGLTTVTGQNQFSGMTLVGCSDNGSICYPSNVLSELKKLKLDTSKLAECTSTGTSQLLSNDSRYCPSSMPAFVQGGSNTQNGRCCSGSANQDNTDCADLTKSYCDITTDPNVFKYPNSCQFQQLGQRLKCPSGSAISAQPGQNSLSGMIIPGCTDTSGNFCADTNSAMSIKTLGFDTSSLTLCPA